MARPTKYNKAILEKANKYLNSFLDLEIVNEVKGGDDAKGDLALFPTVAGLALHLKIARETIYAWDNEEDKKEFSDILGQIQALQEYSLLHGGIRGLFNPVITKLMLTKHGYSDKQEMTGKDGKDLIPSVIQTVYD